MKKQTKVFLTILIVLLFAAWWSYILLFFGPLRPNVSAYNVDENGTVAICQRYRLLLVSRDNSIKKVACPPNDPDSVIVNGDIITIFETNYYYEYDRSNGTMGKMTESSTISKKQDLHKEITKGNSVYSYNNHLGRYRIFETTSSGEVILRYEMPLFDYVVKICAIAFSIMLFGTIPFFIVHVFKTYRMTKHGWVLK